MAQPQEVQPSMVGIVEDDPTYFEVGQRKVGPSERWTADPPIKGSEVFITKIPKDCFEKELIPILRQIGIIYTFRLIMDSEESHRGFGFCVYASEETAKEAVLKLNNFQIRKNCFLGVCFSIDNCRLFVGGILKFKVKSEIFEEMRKVTDDVVDVIVYPSAADKNKNRGFAFVEYTDHMAAATARSKMIENGIKLWGQSVAVDWAEPERKVDQETMSKVKILYVRNLMLTTTEDTIYYTFSKFTNNEDEIVRVKKIGDFAFVHFKNRNQAEIAKNNLNGTELEGSVIEVHFAKPANRMESNQKLTKKKTQSIENILPGDITEHIRKLSIITRDTDGLSSRRPETLETPLSNDTYRSSIKSSPFSTDTDHRSRLYFNNFTMMLIQICYTHGWQTPYFSVQIIPMCFPNNDMSSQVFVAQVYIPGLQCNFVSKTCAFTEEEAILNASESAIEWMYFNGVQVPPMLNQKDLSVKDITNGEIHNTFDNPKMAIAKMGYSKPSFLQQSFQNNYMINYYDHNPTYINPYPLYQETPIVEHEAE